MRCLTQAWQVLSPWQRETVHSRLTVQQMADEFNCLIPGMEHLMSPQMALRHEFATLCANAAVCVGGCCRRGDCLDGSSESRAY